MIAGPSDPQIWDHAGTSSTRHTMKRVKVLMLARAAAWRLPRLRRADDVAGRLRPLTLPVRGEESLMSKKAHGTCEKPVQERPAAAA